MHNSSSVKLTMDWYILHFPEHGDIAGWSGLDLSSRRIARPIRYVIHVKTAMVQIMIYSH